MLGLGPRPATPTPKRSKGPSTDVLGESGESWGQSGDNRWSPLTERNPDLFTPAQWGEACQRMRLNPKIFGADLYSRITIADATFSCEPPAGFEDDPRAIDAAEYGNEVFGWAGKRGRIKGGGWQNQLMQRLQFLGDGCSIGEEIYYIADGKPWLKQWGPRHLSTLVDWERSPDREGVTGATMVNPTDGEQYRLPFDDPDKGALHLALDWVGGDPLGRSGSFCRPCFFGNELTEHTLQQLGIGVERWSMPVPVVKYYAALAEQLKVRPETARKAKEEALTAAKSFMSRERAVLQASDVVGVESFGGEIDVAGPIEVLRELDQRVLTAWFLHWLVIGIAVSHGSRSAAEVHGNIFMRAANFLAGLFCTAIEEQTLRRLVEWTFGPDVPTPKVKHEGLRVDGLIELLPHLPNLTAAGLITQTDDIEDELRKLGDLKRLPANKRNLVRNAAGVSYGKQGPGRGNVAPGRQAEETNQ